MPRPAGPNSFANAAAIVLAEASTPLHYSVITDRAIARGLIKTIGLTPRQTMNARLHDEIRAAARGTVKSRFRVVGRGVYYLTGDDLTVAVLIDRENEACRRALLNIIRDELSPREFEYLIGTLFATMGYERVRVTRTSSDGGIDVEALYSAPGAPAIEARIQVKRVRKSIGAPLIQGLRGSCGINQRPVFVTTSSFTAKAKLEAAAADRFIVQLVDGESLADLLIEHEIGVRAEAFTAYRVDRTSIAAAAANGSKR